MQRFTRDLPGVTRSLFRKRNGSGGHRATTNRDACCFAREHGLDAPIAHARAVAGRVYQDVRVLEPVLRQEVLNDGEYLFVAVEVPEMEAEEFGQRYEAFMDGVWGELENLDPALVTFSVRTRGCA